MTRFRGQGFANLRGVHDGPNASPYPPEYKQRIVDLARSGRSIYSLAAEFEASKQSITNWIRQAARDAGERADGLTTAEREELTRLRRENRQLREEREILKRAAAWFAQESASTPPKRSGS